MKGDTVLKRALIALVSLSMLLTYPLYRALAGGLALNVNGPSTIQANEEFNVTLTADGTDVKTLGGTITLDENLTLVRSEQKLPSPWQIKTQITGQQILFSLSDSTGKSSIDTQTDILVLTLTAKNIGEARINITNLSGTDSDGEFNASQATYKVTVTQSTSTLLASLNADKGSLSPAFSSAVLNYTLTVPYETTQVSLFATAQNKNSLISGAGPISFSEQRKTVNIVITAQDKNTSTIAIQLIRAEQQVNSAQITQSQTPQSTPQSGNALFFVVVLFALSALGISIIVLGLLRQRKRR